MMRVRILFILMYQFFLKFSYCKFSVMIIFGFFYEKKIDKKT